MGQLPARKRDTADLESADHTSYRSGTDLVRRKGGAVWCPRRESDAVVSVVERAGPQGEIRYVQWCSLIDLDDCGHECLSSPAESDQS
jgi:hypothetical protein